MNNKNTYLIGTDALFRALNANRKNNGLTEIDNTLIASKLGILFALKTNGYVNFKGMHVELNDAQLTALREILEQHFNAEMTKELRAFVTTQAQETEKIQEARHFTVSSQADSRGFFNKIRGFLRTKSKIQETPA